MPLAKPWLEQLTAKRLHQLALLLGCPCSGTKSVVVQGIRHTLDESEIRPDTPRVLRLLSFDLGIRNLAFAHLTAPIEPQGTHDGRYGRPTLEAWRRLSVAQLSRFSMTPPRSSPVPASVQEDKDQAESVVALTKARSPVKESFEPQDYAKHAYDLVKAMLELYKPNQILIERQRFRSAGQAAVQEWTIRVGVFEGMLYAVLRTMVEETDIDLLVEPVPPRRVNRYFLEGMQHSTTKARSQLAGREAKKAKTELVGTLLESQGRVGGRQLKTATDAEASVDAFLSTLRRKGRSNRAIGQESLKIDDLADSLLQGLAWIDWQNNRQRVKDLGPEAFDLETDQRA